MAADSLLGASLNGPLVAQLPWLALPVLSAAAQANSGTGLTVAIYNIACVQDVTPDNLAAINDALNSASVDGAATTSLIQLQQVADLLHGTEEQVWADSGYRCSKPRGPRRPAVAHCGQAE